ncbi:type II secretion system pilot lipoprotein GspS [Enterobacter cloacae]|uniref:type II secretion system pilot lipoprotein GspS n=1 Tax=Enterobacter cloacae TaxID=550 RepID=UPI00101B1CAE|nr:type II secretion system pilot lipoprotein GspS [Enterobacter cloacae]QBC03381.1 secretion protein [Enterobacter cloacae]
MKSRFPLTLVIVGISLLVGCQQRTNQTTSAPTTDTQLEQLSALLAGSHFLRENCARADIPGDAQLYSAAMKSAAGRGWDTRQAQYQQLPTRTQQRYELLQQDTTSLAEKCATLNRSTARFIAEVQSAPAG